jgi:hypothetical protein
MSPSIKTHHNKCGTKNKIRKSYRGNNMDLAKIVRLVAVLFAAVAGLVAIPQWS